MVQLEIVWFCFGIMIYMAVFTHSAEIPPDLGPPGPSFGTCENTVCPENSKCIDTGDFVSCMCSPGKTGANCTLDDPCLERKINCPKGSLCFGDCGPNTICEGATGIAHCRGCVPGWTGMQCEIDVNECEDAVNPCLNDGTCQNTKGDFQCTCKEGWTGKICDCKRGSSCDVGEIKTEESKDGKGSQLVCSIIIPFLSFFMYAMLTV
ncbi:neurogenic locus Notch protein-like [Mercenaria mercenaria]|uniref:neurogenic locus Notch protein-like n=1 Tax=Mercenaria mercenaria TaxID=6596 RepID=UPI00234E8D2A|nr:neurogenic locus Notch protein-like [Mercenaria mercenaria]